MAFTIAVIRERRAGETRVAATPDTVKKFKEMGANVLVEAGAGTAASYPDSVYVEAGAKVVGEVLDKADLVLSVRGPEQGQASALKKGAIVVALLDAHREKDLLQALAKAGASAFAMAARAGSPMQSSAKTTSTPRSCDRCAATGFRLYSGATLPFGRPRCEARITVQP